MDYTRLLVSCLLLLLLPCPAFPVPSVPFAHPANADHCLEESELAYYNQQAQQKLDRIKRYFEDAVQKPPLTRRGIARQRRICRVSPETECINYPGVFFTDNFEVREEQITLDKYLAHLSEDAADKAGLTNTCWTTSTEVDFKYTNTTQRAGFILHAAPDYAECTQENPPDENYCVYKAAGYLREEITLFKDNQVERVVKYRQINFELRYLEVEGSDCEYDWQVMIRKIYTVSRKRTKKKLPAKENCPIPEGRCDSTLQYKTVAMQTYAVPGIGWQAFNPKRKLHPWPLVTAVAVGGLAYGSYHKFRSDRYYDRHLGGTKLLEQDDDYRIANQNNHRFLAGMGAAVLAWGGSNLWIYLKDRHRKKLFETRFGCDALDGTTVSWTPPPLSLEPTVLPGATAGLGIKLTWQLNR